MDKIGFSSSCFPGEKSIEEIVRFCLENHFTAMELVVNDTNFDIRNVNDLTIALIQDISSSGIISFGLHSPEDGNFSDPIIEKRASYEIQVTKSIKFAARLGAKFVVVHPGIVPYEFTKENLDFALEQNISAIQRCALTARELDVKVCIENLCHISGSVTPNIVGFMNMCEAIGLSLIGIALDTNHAGLVDGIEKSVSIVGDYVEYIHFSSNKGYKSDHCEPDVGVIDFFTIADFLRKFTGQLIIELNELGSESMNAILRTRDYLYRIQNTTNN